MLTITSTIFNSSERQRMDTPPYSPSHKLSSTDSNIEDLFSKWFLDYASYVICERAIPSGRDGFKPVQRRILHALSELDDGRYIKAANVIGHTMRYHPHGDMAIQDALVKLAQNSMLLDTQGNWGNTLTGDGAAAPRYIEVRLTSFAKDLLFSSSLTKWQDSYDGRGKEPILLPSLFPTLLQMGAEGIAVGLATKIMPHNFCEIIKESIAILQGYPPQLLPDFPTGGIADYSDYRDGKRGSKIKVRARMETTSTSTLTIKEIPFGTTTHSVIQSILGALEKGKIKIKKVEDHTADSVEILVHLVKGTDPAELIPQLYQYTDCEVSLSPQACVIIEGKPVFWGVHQILTQSTLQTKELLGKKLREELHQIEEKAETLELEQIFIQEKIYRFIESASSEKELLSKVEKKLEPFVSQLGKVLTPQKIEKLTEIKIKKISKFNRQKNQDRIRELKSQAESIKKNIENLTPYTIQFFQNLLKRYGASFPRKTKMGSFKDSGASRQTLKPIVDELYIQNKEGFIGTKLTPCATLLEKKPRGHEVLALKKDGQYMVRKLTDKSFFGENILTAFSFSSWEELPPFEMVLEDIETKRQYGKKFLFKKVTRNKDHKIIKDLPRCQIIHFAPSEESDNLSDFPSVSSGSSPFSFSQVSLSPISEEGFLIDPQNLPTKKVKKAKAASSYRLWYNRTKNQISQEQTGLYLGLLKADDHLLVTFKDQNLDIFTSHHRVPFEKPVIHVKKMTCPILLTIFWVDQESSPDILLGSKILLRSAKDFYTMKKSISPGQIFWSSTAPVSQIKVTHGKKNESEEKTEFFELQSNKVQKIDDLIWEKKKFLGPILKITENQ